MDKLISENQSAFVLGRAIGDNVLITHEVLHYLKTSKAEQRCAMAVKTDMSKAYDRLEWDFISLVMLRLGFHQKFVDCLMQCISSVTYSFLINGLPRRKVVPSRGIRQGDPLSPYIFIMCSEVLSGLCNRAQEDGSLKGLRVARASPRINHLLFADDTMFFLEANTRNCTALKDILSKYEEASGQSINKEKSAITFARKTPPELKIFIKDDLQIQKEGGTGKYLGLPELFGRKKRDLFSLIVDRIKQKARSWKNKFLSSAGKLVMIQSVLTAVPSYSMTCFELPVSLCKRIQSAVTRYWWDNNENDKKMAWISWDEMAKPKAAGGLGFRDFQCYDKVLLAKIGWRLLMDPSCLLGRVLFGKYCPDNNILLAPEVSSMSHGWRSVLLGRDLLVQNLGWLVGNGQSINVWNDPWLSTHKQERPMGPTCEGFLELKVSDLMQDESCEWDLQKIQLCIPELEEKVLCIKPSQTGIPDKQIWLGTKSGVYSAKSGYYAVVGSDNSSQGNRFGSEYNWKKNVWNLDCAPKVKLFSWKMLKGALPVGERLTDRHIPVDPLCNRCGESESIIHLFFHCRFARKVWSLAPFASELDCSGMVDLAASWPSICDIGCLPPSGVTLKSLAPWILWNLWKARNKFVFEGHSSSPEDTLSMAISLAREWGSKQKREEPPRAQRHMAQVQLPPGTVIIRSDAAWNLQGTAAGLGWVIHSPSDIRSFKKRSTYVPSALVAEGLALLEAVKAGVEEELEVVRFESDSAQLIKAVNGENSLPEIYGIVADILSFASIFEFVSFTWISRERNGQADMLAKSALIAEETLVVAGVFNSPN